ncbi:hypothetical protein G5B37_05235 [Rasiella rasia]|uniref:Uncharacterized protein n=1 Tax=Rasiella rasia TaxID=2744027 RepID=A0A6G6GK80_9FLAO|nr:hypothetical protein [Rasiella rasia]QIE58985.1 hypothetical protein G5B37_05235 [Rasiella rasia]
MKRVLVLVVCFACFSFMCGNQNTPTRDYFEGQVVYDITYTPYSDSYPIERLKELIGSKMVLTFKNGNYKKEYYAPNGELVQERFVQLKHDKSYFRTKDSDTVYWVDITINDTKTTFTVLKDTVVMNHPCRIITTKSTVSGEGFEGKPIEVKGVTTYAQDLPVNPKWYNNFYEGNFNEISKEGKGIAIVTVNKGMFWEQTLSMTSVTHRKVKNKEIKIKNLKSAPLKQL